MMERINAGRLLRSRSGTTALEFAFVALPFIMLIVGIMEFSRIVWTQSALQSAVEKAARCAAVNETLCTGSDQIRTFILSRTLAPLDALEVAYAVNANCGAEVRASANFAFVVSLFSPSSMTLTAQSCYPT